MAPKNSNYSEDALVERPAIKLFEGLEWTHADCFHEFDDTGVSFLGRDNKADVVLISKLKPVLQKLNKEVPASVIDEAIEIFIQDRSLMSITAANREVYDLLKNGIPVTIFNDHHEEIPYRIRVIDWDNPNNNDFFLASQFWIAGEMYTRRADLIGFVNGIPLLFMELKATHRDLKKAFDDNLRDYKYTTPQLFRFNGIIILSNGSKSRLGTVSAKWDHFSEWKRINTEGEKAKVSLETIIKAVCSKERILDIVENYILFKEEKNGPIKIAARNHQFLGVENAISSFYKVKENEGRLGVFWHTQGSGKSISMIFFSQKILRKVTGNWTFVIVTDRTELDDQIYKNFVRCGIIKGKQERAETSEGLRQLLIEDHRFVFTTIQKFRTEKGKTHPVISDRDNIIVMADEAHRTQYDVFALNMRNALPNAGFIGFTGTPLMAGEEKTKEVFGDYVSVYNFKQAVDDESTVRLFYENRKPKVQLINLSLNEDIQRILEDAELDEVQQRKFEREFSSEYQLITREERLDDIAEDIVTHFMNRGFMGKALVVSVDKAAAVKMYDKVRRQWNKNAHKLHNEYEKATDIVKEELGDKLIFMKQTDMAVIVSQSQNEVEDLKAKGADIISHRKRMNNEDLDEKFKDADDKLRIVFVCAMWMTGFDVPPCSTIYLDKPMKNHTLMQTIARVNRVYGENKKAGFIVDYIGVLHNLNNALALYAAQGEDGIDIPIIDKEELINQLREDVQNTAELLESWGVSLPDILKAEGLECVSLIDDAVECILDNDKRQARFRENNAVIQKTYKAILPDISSNEFMPIVKLLQVMADKQKAVSPVVDISDVLAQVSNLLDKSVRIEPRPAHDVMGHYKKGRILDLSQVDFEKLQERFNKGRKRMLAEQLRKAIETRLQALYMINKSRVNYLDAFQKLIDEYNAGSMNVEEYYKRLIEFIEKLNNEEKRALKENLSEEELAIYDLLTNPPIKITQKDISLVKKTAHDLLERLKSEKLVLDWRKKQQARASVKLCIEEILEHLPPVFDEELYHQKCGLIYQHVYESYFGSSKSIYEKRNGLV